MHLLLFLLGVPRRPDLRSVQSELNALETQLCARLKHCVRIEVNKGGTWATLKSFQV